MAIKVSQATIDAIKKKGMAGAIAQANSGNANAEFVEGAKRFYGSRVSGTTSTAGQQAAKSVVSAAKAANPNAATPATPAKPAAKPVHKAIAHKAAPARKVNVGADTASLHDKNAERQEGMSGTSVPMPPSAQASASRAVAPKDFSKEPGWTDPTGIGKKIGHWFISGDKAAAKGEKARQALKPPPKPKTPKQIEDRAAALARGKASSFDIQKQKPR